jgi:hypothetical protein
LKGGERSKEQKKERKGIGGGKREREKAEKKRAGKGEEIR